MRVKTKYYRIRDICTIKSGKRLPAGFDFSNEPTPYRYIRSRDIKGGKITLDDVAYIDKEIKKKINKYIINDGDIAITIVANIGDIGFATAECDGINLTENAVRLTSFNHNTVFSKYLAYYLNQPFMKAHMENIAAGAAQAKLGIYKIEKMKVQLPELSFQKSIVNIIEKYDNLIELNNKRIKLLEQMAENLYKEWFVRFRFPGHETAEFENGIPKGWEYKRIGNLAPIKSGFAFKSEWWTDEGIPAIKIKDIVSNAIDLSDLSRVSQEYADKAKQFYVSAGDLLIALTGATIGKIALVPYAEKMTVNQRVGRFFLSGTPWKSVAFLFCFFLQDNVQEEILSIAGSNAAQPNISPFDVENLKTYYSENIVKQFNDMLSPVILSILKFRKQNDNLIRQRDLLLPRLMSGKLKA